MSSEDRKIPVRWGGTAAGDRTEDQGEHKDGFASQQKGRWIGKRGLTGIRIVSMSPK